MVRKALRFEKRMTLKKGAWSHEEDQKLIAYIDRYGIWNWGEMPKAAGLLRSGKSCRLRWVNYLRPGVKHGNFTREEQETIFKMQEMLGNKWSAIAAALPGRTDNEVKNHWHARLKKQLRKQKKQKTQSQVSSSNEVSDGQKNVPELTQLPSGLCSSPNASPAIEINENGNLEADLWSETFGELFSLWEEPLSVENLYLENLQDMFVNPGFVLPQCELWLSEPTSPYGFYDDLWFNFNLSVPTDMAALKEPKVHF